MEFYIITTTNKMFLFPCNLTYVVNLQRAHPYTHITSMSVNVLKKTKTRKNNNLSHQHKEQIHNCGYNIKIVQYYALINFFIGSV